jgi:hypothetical protein
MELTKPLKPRESTGRETGLACVKGARFSLTGRQKKIVVDLPVEGDFYVGIRV